MTRNQLALTGIGGCACARHGCFVPHAMVDFQKGEQYVLYIIISSMCSGSHRQINMDYALVQAVWHASSPKQKVVTFYDINCQYSQNLVCWIWSNNFISLPDGLQILPGIGIWHVHGHKSECFPQYAPNFIPGAGRVDGEIMETLWSSLNIISPSARGMATPHQQESLDFQMSDRDRKSVV